jgi:hypothetical protein
VLITFSFNTVSQGLDTRHGLLPRFPIYSVSASREQLIGSMRGSRYDVTSLKEEASTLRRLAQADERVRHRAPIPPLTEELLTDIVSNLAYDFLQIAYSVEANKTGVSARARISRCKLKKRLARRGR